LDRGIIIFKSLKKGLSSTSDILENKTLRYAVWIMALFTFFGNASVLWKRFRDENRNVSIVIRNLAFSDCLMGVYLTLIAYMDAYYRDSYHENSDEWVNSWECVLIGVLAVTSSEVSILILKFMSIERFLLISDPFGHRKIDTKNVILSLYSFGLSDSSLRFFPSFFFAP
jgi:leucine-rich repeat-containing G protein-coupled receptor 8